MEKIIFLSELKELIIEKIKEHSIDALYLGKHPFFIPVNAKSYAPNPFIINFNVLFSTILKKYNIKYNFFNRDIDYKFSQKIKYRNNSSYNYRSDYLFENLHDQYIHFKKIDEILSKTKRDDTKTLLSDKEKNIFYEVAFNDWLDKNYEDIRKHQNDKTSKIESIKEKIKEIGNQISTNNTEINSLEEEISSTEEEIKNLPNKEKKVLEAIQDIDNEIIQLESLKDKEPYKSRIDKLEKSKKTLSTNFSKEKNALEHKNTKLNATLTEKRELEKTFKDDLSVSEKELNNLENTNFDFKKEQEKYSFIRDILRFNEFDGRSNVTVQDILAQIFGKYVFQKGMAWKELLIKLFNTDIPESFVFYEVSSPTSILYPKLASIIPTSFFDKKDNLPPMDNELFAIWYSLREALQRNRITKTTSGIFYISFHNGIFARIFVRDSKITNSETVVALKYTNGFYTKRSPFWLANGVYIHYEGFSFEIDFFDNALLLQSFNYQEEEEDTSSSNDNSYDDDDD